MTLYEQIELVEQTFSEILKKLDEERADLISTLIHAVEQELADAKPSKPSKRGAK